MTLRFDPEKYAAEKCPPHVWVRYYPVDRLAHYSADASIPGEFYRCDDCGEPGYPDRRTRFLHRLLVRAAKRSDA